MREYIVAGPGGAYTVQLSDEDAKSRGLTEDDLVSPPEVKARAVANKQARAPQNKQPQKD